ncbi:pilin [Aestuariirhabdus sp. Z084]|uniref:pilin n=1 Tax=Aestuariirhabdus haliotis TaxID=2918751 RepID=UPI00201B3B97|nr:pilin [Aestuariirhabdus haliotis]MCL6416088.1 pilin [Aestuariirhabdus haliotis]MCL6419344.1 pilin [Aestuariirhabdus haliotis]
MKTMQKGFTLIELMIVVAIIGILAAVAIPAYQDYIARAQVSEGVSLMAAGKTPLAEWYADKGVWPNDTASVMGNTSGKYVASVEITTGAALTGDLVMEVTFRSTGVNAEIADKTVEMGTTDGGRNWDCASGGTDAIEDKYLPGACR